MRKSSREKSMTAGTVKASSRLTRVKKSEQRGELLQLLIVLLLLLRILLLLLLLTTHLPDARDVRVLVGEHQQIVGLNVGDPEQQPLPRPKPRAHHRVIGGFGLYLGFGAAASSRAPPPAEPERDAV